MAASVVVTLLVSCRTGATRNAALHTRQNPEIKSLAQADRGAAGPQETGVFEWRDQYEQAMSRARAWLDTVQVDPLELRAHNIKGKKKLVELLEAYYRLWQVATPEEKGPLLARIREIVEPTYHDDYHDMLSISDEWFKQVNRPGFSGDSIT